MPDQQPKGSVKSPEAEMPAAPEDVRVEVTCVSFDQWDAVAARLCKEARRSERLTPQDMAVRINALT